MWERKGVRCSEPNIAIFALVPFLQNETSFDSLSFSSSLSWHSIYSFIWVRALDNAISPAAHDNTCTRFVSRSIRRIFEFVINNEFILPWANSTWQTTIARPLSRSISNNRNYTQSDHLIFSPLPSSSQRGLPDSLMQTLRSKLISITMPWSRLGLFCCVWLAWLGETLGANSFIIRATWKRPIIYFWQPCPQTPTLCCKSGLG
jgi:hypothetical protein